MRLVEIKNDHPQILYIEGEPRWEFKFLRRAMQDDPNIRLVTLAALVAEQVLPAGHRQRRNACRRVFRRRRKNCSPIKA